MACHSQSKERKLRPSKLDYYFLTPANMLPDALCHMSSTRSDKAPYGAASYAAELSSISRGDASSKLAVSSATNGHIPWSSVS